MRISSYKYNYIYQQQFHLTQHSLKNLFLDADRYFKRENKTKKKSRTHTQLEFFFS